MSAFVWLDPIVTRARSTRGACAWLFALLALAASGAVLAQTANSIDSMTVAKSHAHAPRVGRPRVTMVSSQTNALIFFAPVS